MKATIPLTYLLAIAQFASKKDIRYYLNGVYVNPKHIVGTDGSALGAIESPAGIEGDVVIPNDAIDKLKKLIPSKSTVTAIIEITVDNRVGTIRCDQHGVIIPFTPVDGRYPDYERVIAKHEDPKGWPHFDWTYMSAFLKAGAILTGNSKFNGAHIVPNGRSGARVMLAGFDGKFHGVLMPMSPRTMDKVKYTELERKIFGGVDC